MTRRTGTLRGTQNTFMIITRPVLLWLINVSYKFVEKIKTHFAGFRFLWPCIVIKVWRDSKNLYLRNVCMCVCMYVCIYVCIMYVCLHNMKREGQQDATIRCLLSTYVWTCFGHHYAHLQEIKDRVTAFGVLLWFCWMWLVAVVGALSCRM